MLYFYRPLVPKCILIKRRNETFLLQNADPYDIKMRLTRLEQSLKQEGLYKNVKSDFVHLRKDILGVSVTMYTSSTIFFALTLVCTCSTCKAS